MSQEDKMMFLSELNLTESGLDRLVTASYSLLGLISYLTAGKPEVRAWTIQKGTKAPQAAGKIHSDFERGFICAEVVSFEDLTACGSMAAVCGFVVFFYVLASPLARLGGTLGAGLVGFLELFSLTPLLAADRGGFILASVCAGWGGVSILCQTAAVLEDSGLRLRNCAAGKAVQGLLAGGLAAAASAFLF